MTLIFVERCLRITLPRGGAEGRTGAFLTGGGLGERECGFCYWEWHGYIPDINVAVASEDLEIG